MMCRRRVSQYSCGTYAGSTYAGSTYAGTYAAPMRHLCYMAVARSTGIKRNKVHLLVIGPDFMGHDLALRVVRVDDLAPISAPSTYFRTYSPCVCAKKPFGIYAQGQPYGAAKVASAP
jgi:hypothetical protein